MNFYPEFAENTEFSLVVVRKALAENADYLDDPDCPYNGKLREMLRHLAPAASGTDIPIPDGTEHRTTDELEQEINVLLNDIKDFGQKLTGVEDTTEKMSYFRTHSNLLEKLVTMKERVAGIKQVAVFQSVVLSAIEESLTPDQRTQVMDALRKSIEMGVPA